MELEISFNATPAMAEKLAELGSVEVSDGVCLLRMTSSDPGEMLEKARRLAELTSEAIKNAKDF